MSSYTPSLLICHPLKRVLNSARLWLANCRFGTDWLNIPTRFPASSGAMQAAIGCTQAQVADQQHEPCTQQCRHPVHLLTRLPQAHPRSQRQRSHHHSEDCPGCRHRSTTRSTLLRAHMLAQRHLIISLLTVFATHIIQQLYHRNPLWQANLAVFSQHCAHLALKIGHFTIKYAARENRERLFPGIFNHIII